MGTEKDVRRDITKMRYDIEHDRRMYMKGTLLAYDQSVYMPRMVRLQLECERTGGHSWIFSSWGFMPGIEFQKCMYCGQGKTINHNEEGEAALETKD